jgi:hypothetical protein
MSKTIRYNPDTNKQETERRHLKRKQKQERTVKLNRKKLEQDERDYR